MTPRSANASAGPPPQSSAHRRRSLPVHAGDARSALRVALRRGRLSSLEPRARTREPRTANPRFPVALAPGPVLCSATLLRILHMAKNDALQGALPILVLKILHRRGPLHGYAITTQIETASQILRV